MKIWHVGAATSPHAVDGVSAIVYTLAEEQLKAVDERSNTREAALK